jgi:cytochrome c biogenesis protein
MMNKIWNAAGSIRIVIPLLIAIALVSLVGIVVPQGTPSMEFHDSGWRAALIMHLGLDHLFSSWWFYALLGLLSINVVACATSHQIAHVRMAIVPHFLKCAEDAILLKCSTEFTVNRAPEKTVPVFLGHFKRRLYFSSSLNHENGVQVTARSFCFKELGSLFFHVSILFFFAGGAVEGLHGFSFVKYFRKGEVHAVRGWNYLVRSDWFKIQKNTDGAVSGYTSKLSVLSSDSTPIFSKIIEVNHPLNFKGLSFYQNSYGELPDAIEDATVRINGPGLDPAGLKTVVPFNVPVRLPELGLTLVVKRFIDDFDFGATMNDVIARINKPNNPAIRAVLLKGNDTLYDNWSFVNFPDISQDAKSGYKIAFLTFTPRYCTGIKISRNPGAALIWLGFALMTLGIMLVFYFPRTSYWIFIKPVAEGSSRITVGGSSDRPLSVFQEKFKRTCAHLQSRFKEET